MNFSSEVCAWFTNNDFLGSTDTLLVNEMVVVVTVKNVSQISNAIIFFIADG
jgi:hypothetical protein